jgi:hypothetical protein
MNRKYVNDRTTVALEAHCDKKQKQIWIHFGIGNNCCSMMKQGHFQSFLYSCRVGLSCRFCAKTSDIIAQRCILQLLFRESEVKASNHSIRRIGSFEGRNYGSSPFFVNDNSRFHMLHSNPLKAVRFPPATRRVLSADATDLNTYQSELVPNHSAQRFGKAQASMEVLCSSVVAHRAKL